MLQERRIVENYSGH